MSRLWSESQEKLFTDLWNQGLDTNVIGTRMAEVGRPLASSSVIDRARRMQLKPRHALPPIRTNGWTFEEEEVVAKLWGEGQSATDISFVISKMRGKSVSRNSVIGKVHRMGLQKRVAPSAPKYTKPKKRTVSGHEPRLNTQASHTVSTPIKLKKETKPLPKPRKADKDRIGPTLMELKPNACRWPVGVKPNGEQMFCGEALKPGTSYCCEHHAVSVSKVSVETREKQAEAMRGRHRQGRFNTAHYGKKRAA